MMKKINYGRILSIGGLTLCTTLIATGFRTEEAIINALLIAGVALFTELKLESTAGIKVQGILNKGLIV